MKTPFVQYRQSAFLANCRRLAAQFSASQMDWMPELSGLLPRDLLDNIRAFTSKASCRRLEDLLALSDAGFTDLSLTRPVSDISDLREIIERIHHCELTFVADHFRQAELLSHVAREARCSICILIDTECGRQLTGVRPGPDSARLAEAISRLPGLRVAGVYVDDEAVTTAGSSMALSSSEIVSPTHPEIVASHNRRMIQAIRIACPHLVSGRFINPLERPSSEVTRCLLNPLERSAASNTTICETAQMDVSGSGAWTVATRVLSRPTLETCVIDIGRSIVAAHATVISPPGAALLQTAADVSSLVLTGTALDVRIGDLVELEVDWRTSLHLPVVRQN